MKEAEKEAKIRSLILKAEELHDLGYWQREQDVWDQILELMDTSIERELL